MSFAPTSRAAAFGAPLDIFVYGTLKKGERNHARYCRGVVGIEPATIQGRLYRMPAGYPMLVTPREAILDFGSLDAAADIAKLSGDYPPPVEFGPEWPIVEGELIRLTDPESHLAALDGLEDYRPAEQTGEYCRVLVWLLTPKDRLAWTYVAPGGAPPAGAMAIGGRWP